MTRARANALSLLALSLALAPACRDATSSSTPAAPTPVVRAGPLEDRFTLTGELAAAKSDVLRAPRTPTWMITIKWLAEHGAVVKKGDKVVEFDTSSLTGSLADRRLALQRAQSDLVSDGARTAAAELDKRLEVERRRAALEKARAEAAIPADLRTRREHQEKALAVVKEEDALAKAEEALAAQVRAARLDRRVKEIALSRATRELADLESRLDDLTLRAPRDGLVQVSTNFRGEGRKYQIGDATYAGLDVVTIPNLTVMQVRARLHDVDEGAIKVGMPTACVLDGYPDRTLAGRIESITPIARPEGRESIRRIFDVVVKLDATDPAIMLPGMSVRVEVIRRRADQALLVPRHALGRKEGAAHARLADGTVVPVEVEFCALQDCALRAGPPAGTALAAPVTTPTAAPAAKGEPS